MKYIIVLLILVSCINFSANGQKVDTTFITPYEESNGMQTTTYQQTISYYKALSKKYQTIDIQAIGKSDGGYDELYLVTYSTKIRKKVQGYPTRDKNKDVVLLINNGIHPGEPDGVDACMMLIRDAAKGKIKVPENIVLAVIPIYNIGGALNRSSSSRANQNGPESYGFRGNAKNLDLNRDFIKQDANETRCLENTFRILDPDIFIDNHVSDGADYQHVMTLLSTQHNKLSGGLGGGVGEYMYKTLTPQVYKEMKQRGYVVVPYVNDFDNTPDNGWREFYDPPRFSSGYASLFQTFAFVPETHMLKPFKQRVEATYTLMQCFVKIAAENSADIKKARNKDRLAMMKQNIFPLDWKVDTTQCDSVLFSGYEARYKPSEVSGLPRLFYDHNKPFTKNVPFYNHYAPSKTVMTPKAYIIPKAWEKVIAILSAKDIRMVRFQHDTTIVVTAYHIDNYETVPKPYESHYMHKNIQVTPNKISMQFKKGDCIIPVNQALKRYLIETLEPTAPDAFLAWNFFDGILQQKEYYSDYVFEDVAAEILKNDTLIKSQLATKRQQDSTFAKNGAAQLDFLYRHSKYMETEYLQYPVFRLEE